MIQEESSWVEEEFIGIDFGDERLNSRFHRVVDRLSQQPMSPINQAQEDWAATKAAYRFFKNEKVEVREILSAHLSCVIRRLKEHKIVLAVQDTTFLNYDGHQKTEGLGSIRRKGDSISLGLVMHTTMAFNPRGVPLGLIEQEIWARDPKRSLRRNAGLRSVYQDLPLEKKESHKWLKGLRTTKLLGGENSRVITIADRESDIYDFVFEAIQVEEELLLRVNCNRELRGERKRLWDYMLERDIKGYMRVEIPAREGKEEREVKLSIRFSGVRLKAPAKSKARGDLSAHMILVREEESIGEGDRLEWMLLSTSEVKDKEEAEERVRWYKIRWSIEQYHRILKSGCRVESCKLSTAERLKRYLTLMSVIAWRIYWLTHVNRENPNGECSLVLEEHEWKALYCKINRTAELPKKQPTVRETIRWVARLGGFLGRKGDGEPGPTTVWRGWQRLVDIADTWLILHHSTCG